MCVNYLASKLQLFSVRNLALKLNAVKVEEPGKTPTTLDKVESKGAEARGDDFINFQMPRRTLNQRIEKEN